MCPLPGKRVADVEGIRCKIKRVAGLKIFFHRCNDLVKPKLRITVCFFAKHFNRVLMAIDRYFFR